MPQAETHVTLDLRRYDLQGVMIPGLIVCTSILAFFLKRFETGLRQSIEWISDLSHTPPALFLALVILVAAFVIGHVIDGLAQFMYQEILTRRWRGYMFPILIGNVEEARPLASHRDRNGKAILACLIVTVALLPASRHFRIPVLDPGTFGASPEQLSFLSATLNLLLTTPVQLLPVLAILACLALLTAKSPQRRGKLLRVLHRHVSSRLWKSCADFFDRLDHVICLPVPTREPLPHKTRELLEERFTGKFGMSMSEAGRDAYWWIYFQTMSQESHSRERVSAAYSHMIFSRNASLAFLFSSLVLAFGTNVGGFTQTEFTELLAEATKLAQATEKSVQPRFMASDISARYAVVSGAMLILGLFFWSRFHHWFDHVSTTVIRAFIANDRRNSN